MRATLRTFLIWAIVYPCVVFGLMALQALYPNMPLWLETGITTALLVPFISLVAAPIVTRHVYPDERGPPTPPGDGD